MDENQVWVKTLYNDWSEGGRGCVGVLRLATSLFFWNQRSDVSGPSKLWSRIVTVDLWVEKTLPLPTVSSPHSQSARCLWPIFVQGFNPNLVLVHFSPELPPLNRAASKFGTTVLEGFYELSKILEISISSIDKVHVREISGPSVAGAQSNRLWKLASPFLPRSKQKILYEDNTLTRVAKQ